MTPDHFTSRGLIPCLTVLQPFAAAIVANIKPVENRSWQPPAWLVGRRLLIHAGLDERYLKNPHTMNKVRGIWVGCPRRFVRGAIIGHALVGKAVTIQQRPIACPWSSGPWCWQLSNALQIEPIEFRGMQRVFGVPASALPPWLVLQMTSKRHLNDV